MLLENKLKLSLGGTLMSKLQVKRSLMSNFSPIKMSFTSSLYNVYRVCIYIKLRATIIKILRSDKCLIYCLILASRDAPIDIGRYSLSADRSVLSKNGDLLKPSE